MAKREDRGVTRNLDEYVRNYRRLDFEEIQEKYRLKRLIEVLDRLNLVYQFKNILEVGPGCNTVYSVFPSFDSYTILEPIDYFHSLIEPNVPKAILNKVTVESFFDSNPTIKFDLVILSSVIHELEDPNALLVKARALTASNCKILVVVPNNMSLHRILGEINGHSKSGPILTETEKLMQQTISFSVDSFTRFAESCGFKMSEIFTSFVKPHPHFRMHEMIETGDISQKDLENLYSISSILEPHGSEIFAVLEKSND